MQPASRSQFIQKLYAAVLGFALPVALFAQLTSAIEQNESEAAANQAAESNGPPPPDPEKGMPVVRIFKDYLYASELPSDGDEAVQEANDKISSFIWDHIRQELVKKFEIKVTPDEVNEYLEATVLKNEVVLNNFKKRYPDKSKEELVEQLRSGMKPIAARYIEQWKIDRALYKKYGGDVIFQQGNPYEPVGAYCKYLEELERDKQLELYDRDARARFMEYYTREQPIVIPPDQVNFDLPWWLQKARLGDSDRPGY